MLVLQVLFIILSALFATGFFFAGVWLGWNWAIIFAIFAVVCYFLSMTFKNTLAMRNPPQNNEENNENEK